MSSLFYWFQMVCVCVGLSVSDLPCLLSIPGNIQSVRSPPRAKSEAKPLPPDCVGNDYNPSYSRNHAE